MRNRFLGAAAGLLACCAAGAIVAPSGLARQGPSRLAPSRLLVSGAQVGPRYRLHERPDSHGVRGFVTLDVCGFRFASESLRVARVQVDYVRTGSPVKVSNEVVVYRPGGTLQAFRELTRAVATCPHRPVASAVRGVPPLTYRIVRIHDGKLLPGSIALVIKATGTVNGNRFRATYVAAYQRRGDVLSGVYGTGGSPAAARAITLHAAEQSARNLVRT